MTQANKERRILCQMELPSIMDSSRQSQRGEHVIKQIRLVAPASSRCAWYELRLVSIPHGFIIEKVSGATGQGKLREAWFRRERIEAEKKFDLIVTDKTNPLRRSPRKYIVEQITSRN